MNDVWNLLNLNVCTIVISERNIGDDKSTVVTVFLYNQFGSSSMKWLSVCTFPSVVQWLHWLYVIALLLVQNKRKFYT